MFGKRMAATRSPALGGRLTRATRIRTQKDLVRFRLPAAVRQRDSGGRGDEYDQQRGTDGATAVAAM
jgi:hypothetical protein